MRSPERVELLCEEGCSLYDELIGVVLDGTMAMGELARWYMNEHRRLLDEAHQKGMRVSSDELDPLVTYNGVAEDSSGPLHETTMLTFVHRNTPGGSNWDLLIKSCLVMAYQQWEDGLRGRIAEAIGKKREDIQLPIFGELRYLRNAIVHNRSRATASVAKNGLLPRFESGQQIHFTPTDYFTVMFKLKRALREYSAPESASA